MIAHTVLFRLARPTNADAKRDFEERLRRFAQKAPHASGARVDTDLGLREEGPSVTEYAMTVYFDDEDAFAAYLTDPAHVDLVESTLRPACDSWLSTQSRYAGGAPTSRH